ncbi:hypothetical protein [Burkholderia sp. Ac-20379]|uniref:hypothetical protein n=1 Tax=Burkholderia sp. Ac-20379 TaxID=2703900 RepID=UPI0019802047|nr:hypothetical protein [Burkholderia sp. Ac-20379]MBN3723408.1 hypothetical protein [Burkholderia sp. Ac-20379]
MTHPSDEPKRLDFDTEPERKPGRPLFDAAPAAAAPAPRAPDTRVRPIDLPQAAPSPSPSSQPARPAMPAPSGRPAPAALDLGPSSPRSEPRSPAAEAVGKSLFGGAEHPQLQACFDAARAAYPNLYPEHGARVERHIRQLLPPRLATVATIGDTALAASGDLVEAIADTTREFGELNAADLMAGLLAQATRKDGMLDRWFRPTTNTPVDYRAALGALKQSLGFFPRRTAMLADKLRHADESLVVVLAALSAVTDVVRIPDDAGLERTLHDRRSIVAQALQQLRMQPVQLSGLDERATDLMSRADHLMNVVLPAAHAARLRS